MGEIGKRKIKLENILAVAKDCIENIECNSGRKYSRAMKNAVNNYRKVVRLARKIEKSYPDYRILLNKSIVDKLSDFNRYKRDHRNDWLSPAIYATSIAIIGVGALIAADYSLRKANAQDIPAAFKRDTSRGGFVQRNRPARPAAAVDIEKDRAVRSAAVKPGALLLSCRAGDHEIIDRHGRRVRVPECCGLVVCGECLSDAQGFLHAFGKLHHAVS